MLKRIHRQKKTGKIATLRFAMTSTMSQQMRSLNGKLPCINVAPNLIPLRRSPRGEANVAFRFPSLRLFSQFAIRPRQRRRAFRRVQMLGSPTNPAATRTGMYASNGLAGLTTQMGPYQRPEPGGGVFQRLCSQNHSVGFARMWASIMLVSFKVAWYISASRSGVLATYTAG